MKSFVVAFAVLAVVAADVAHLVRSPEADAQTLEERNDVGIESFNYGYKTSNGIQADEQGALKQVGPQEAAVVVQGSNAYTAPGGEVIQIEYIADENGYQPRGAHLPTPPPPLPIPEYILRALQYIAEHPQQPETSIKRI